MQEIYAVSLISTALALCAWMTFDKKWKISGYFRNVFFISFLIYLLSFYFSHLGWLSSSIVLFRDLVFIAGTAAIFYFFKKNFFVSLFFLISLIFSSPLLYNYLTDSDKEESIASTPEAEISKDWELIIEIFPEEDISTLNTIIAKYGLEVERAFYPQNGDITDLDDYYVIGIPQKNESKIQQIESELNANKAVEWLEPNELIKLSPIDAKTQRKKITEPLVNDPLISNQWIYNKMDLNSYYEYLSKQKINPVKKAKLFILDTGVDSRHEDLEAYYKSYDDKGDKDDMGHGTHCAGIAAGVTNNSKGIASLIPNNSFVEISGIKVLSSFGGSQKTVINGMVKAVDFGADVISMSLGGRSTQVRQKAYNEAVRYASDNNAIVIVAAGNSNQDAKDYCPANSKNVITVSAVNEDLEKAFFSNTVENIQFGIAAPGKDIYSTYPNDKYRVFSGTSMAAPFVAGLVSLMKSLDPELDVVKAHRILSSTGIDTKDNEKTGKVVQPFQAVKLITEEMMN